jgi:hypothetical protein
MRIVGKAIETVALARAEMSDPLDKPTPVSDPGLRVSRYDGTGRAPVRTGNFGRADVSRREAPGFWPKARRKVRLAEDSGQRVRVEQREEEAEATEPKRRRLAVVAR